MKLVNTASVNLSESGHLEDREGDAKIELKWAIREKVGYEDGTGSVSCEVVGFDINGETLGSSTGISV
jgi:hypothetical protein